MQLEKRELRVNKSLSLRQRKLKRERNEHNALGIFVQGSEIKLLSCCLSTENIVFSNLKYLAHLKRFFIIILSGCDL